MGNKTEDKKHIIDNIKKTPPEALVYFDFVTPGSCFKRKPCGTLTLQMRKLRPGVCSEQAGEQPLEQGCWH